MTSDKLENQSDGSENHSDLSSDNFDSDNESGRESVATEIDEEPIFDKTDIAKAVGEVDLTGFHDVCRKILRKQIPEGCKSGILCKNKMSTAADRRAGEKDRKKKNRAESKKKRNWENLAREKPDNIGANPIDRNLESIAKRGVVDFFNAIEKHQIELKRKLEDAGPTELRKSKVIKSTTEKDIIEKIDDQQKRVPKVQKKWSVLSTDDAALLGGELDDEPMDE